MMQLSSKNDDSSLCYDVIITHQIFKNSQFGDFSSEIDFNTKMDIFRDVISLIINQCDSRRPKGASGGYEVSAGGSLRSPGVTLVNYTEITSLNTPILLL